jgi:hypothetical protein
MYIIYLIYKLYYYGTAPINDINKPIKPATGRRKYASLQKAKNREI